MSKRRNRKNRQGWVSRNLKVVGREPVVVVGTPALDTCLTSYTRCLVEMVAYSIAKGLVLGYSVVQYSILPHSRNELVRHAMEREATHLLFIDSDMEFPPDTAVRLVKHGKPIVAANCMARRRPYSLTARAEDGTEIVTREDSAGLEKAARVGTGVVMIDLDVFRSIPEPWFDFKWRMDDQGRAHPVGEDFVFIDAVREADIEIFVDHDISKEVSHVGTFQFNPLLRAGFEEVEREMAAAEGR